MKTNIYNGAVVDYTFNGKTYRGIIENFQYGYIEVTFLNCPFAKRAKFSTDVLNRFTINNQAVYIKN